MVPHRTLVLSGCSRNSVSPNLQERAAGRGVFVECEHGIASVLKAILPRSWWLRQRRAIHANACITAAQVRVNREVQRSALKSKPIDLFLERAREPPLPHWTPSLTSHNMLYSTTQPLVNALPKTLILHSRGRKIALAGSHKTTQVGIGSCKIHRSLRQKTEYQHNCIAITKVSAHPAHSSGILPSGH